MINERSQNNKNVITGNWFNKFCAINAMQFKIRNAKER